MTSNLKSWLALTAATGVCFYPGQAHAMHIAEGLLPAPWALAWFAAAAPVVAWGVRRIRSRAKREPHYKSMVGLVGAAVFLISVLPIPVPVVGSCSHPCGTGLAAILIGPAPAVVVAGIALLLQALFLAHGGLSTLGGNIVSMGVAGAFAGYGAYRLSLALGAPKTLAAFMAGLLADWATYAVTSFELSIALHGGGDWLRMFIAVALAFVPTQLPLGILEGFITAGAFKFVLARRPDLLRLITGEAGK